MSSSSERSINEDAAPPSPGRQTGERFVPFDVIHEARVCSVSWGRLSFSQKSKDDSAFARQMGRRNIPGRKTDKCRPGMMEQRKWVCAWEGKTGEARQVTKGL